MKTQQCSNYFCYWRKILPGSFTAGKNTQTFQDLGIQTVRERFPFCAAISERSELRFGKETLFCSAYPCTRDTGAVGVQGKLIYIPRISDAEDTSIKQAIILTESDFNERCKKLLVAGSAAGVITYKKGRSQHDMPACFLPQEPCSDLLTAIEICTTDAMRLLLSGVETVKIVMQSREQLLKRLLIPQTGLRTLNQIYGGDNRPFQAIGVDTLTFSRGGKLIDALMHTKDDTLQNAGITDHSLRCAAQRVLNIIYPIIFG